MKRLSLSLAILMLLPLTSDANADQSCWAGSDQGEFEWSSNDLGFYVSRKFDGLEIEFSGHETLVSAELEASDEKKRLKHADVFIDNVFSEKLQQRWDTEEILVGSSQALRNKFRYGGQVARIDIHLMNGDTYSTSFSISSWLEHFRRAEKEHYRIKPLYDRGICGGGDGW